MKRTLQTQFILCIVSAFLGAGLAYCLVWQANQTVLKAESLQETGDRDLPFVSRDVPEPSYSAEELSNIQIYETFNKSVVNISTRSYSRDPFFMRSAPQEGSGSGSVLDRSGHILTNFHVIEGASFVSVTLFDGSSYAAEIVGADPENDTAVLRIKAPEAILSPVQFGDSSNLKVGQNILAIGNPFGLERTLSVGIISALNRTLPGRVRGYSIKEVIQIDAALNRGNSGGPLLNNQGFLVGMNTAIANPSGSGENTGVGFAIPVNTLRSVVPQLIKHGKVIRPDLGIIHTTPLREGLRINVLAPGGPATKAGLRGVRVVRRKVQQGRYLFEYETPDYDYADQIVRIEGQSVATYSDLIRAIEGKKPGEKVVVEVIREGVKTKVPVVLGEQK
ncbi:MAG: trypsin-like peptidase domain-containing protein [Planctomycetota bacterium]|nr:trypsin-like peptidase domain-containing protein [Planctomycetota bacterium]